MMLTAKTVKGMAERLARAEALVADGAVRPVTGLAGYYGVASGEHLYLVRTEPGHECCSCADFSDRQRALGLPCKHLLAAQLTEEAAAAPAPIHAQAVDGHALPDGRAALARLQAADADDPYPLTGAA